MLPKLLLIGLLGLSPNVFAQKSHELGDPSRKINVSLVVDEEMGGRTISQYVGKSDNYLLNRLMQQDIATASTFVDVETAQKAVNEVIAINRQAIANWWISTSPRQAFSATVNTKARMISRYLFEKHGRSTRSREISETKVRVILVKKDDHWFVLLAYPDPQ
ncbi:MAG: hypothetical protein RIT27_1412 [Pseudomonadota bacterium]|jgi:hypothetical protein